MNNNTQIKLNIDAYDFQVQGISSANSNLDSSCEKPELSGNMPSMKETVNTFEDISDMIGKCKLMCTRLEGNLKAAADIIKNQDKALAGTK